MKLNRRSIIIIVVVVCFIGSNVASFIGGRCSVDPEIVIVKKETIKWKEKIVYRDYEKMDCLEMQKELLAYDTAKPRLDGTMYGDVFHATAGLHDREWSRDFKLKSGSGDPAKYYFITSFISFLAGAVVGGAVDYKFVHHP